MARQSERKKDLCKKLDKVTNFWQEKNLPIQKLAAIFFEETQGNHELLTSVDWMKRNGIWGKIAERVFQRNDQRHRLWMRNAWKENRKGLVDFYKILKGESFDVSVIPKGRSVIAWCFCQKRPMRYKHQPSCYIYCNFCYRWFHMVCVNVTEKEVEAKKYCCLECNGGKFPALFEHTTILENSLIYQTTDAANDSQTSEILLSEASDNQYAASDSQRSDALQSEESDNQSVSSLIQSERVSSTSWDDQQSVSEEGCEKDSVKPGANFDSDVVSDIIVTGNIRKDAGSESDLGSSSNTSASVEKNSMPYNFNFDLTYNEFLQIVSIEGEGASQRHRIQSEFFHNKIAKKFSEVNKGCVLSFTKKVIRQPVEMLSGNKIYLRAYAFCKRFGKDRSCLAKYAFWIEAIPKPGAMVPVTVRLTADSEKPAHHNMFPAFRWLKGAERNETKKRLVDGTASKVRLEDAAVADQEKLKLGNISDIRTSRIYQAAKAELEKENVLSSEVWTDILLQHYKFKQESKIRTPHEKRVKGYTQQISAIPFFAIMYYFESLEIFHEATMTNDVTIFLDATSGVCKSFRKPLDDRRLFLYSMVIKAPVKGRPQIPICEMLSADQSSATIRNMLASFWKRYNDVYTDKRLYKGIEKIGVDFSVAMISAVITFFHGPKIQPYFVEIWKALTENRKANVFPIHVCRWHVERAFRTKERINLRGKSEVQDVWEKLGMRLLYLQSLDSFKRAVIDIGIIGCSKYMTPEVRERLSRMSTQTSKCNFRYVRKHPSHHKLDVDTLYREDNFWQQSPFGAYGHSVIQAIREDEKRLQLCMDELTIAELQLNPYRSRKMVNYFTKHVFPYLPILSRTIFLVSQIPVRDDTTGVVEGYFKILKHDLRTKRSQRPVNFIRNRAKFQLGQCNKYIGECMTNTRGTKKSSKNRPTSRDTAANLLRKFDDLNATNASSNLKRQKPLAESTPKSRKRQKLRRSPESRVETHKDGRKKPHSVSRNDADLANLKKSVFIPWGGRYIDSMGVEHGLTNTCTIDNMLHIIHYLYTYRKEGKALFSTQADATDECGINFCRIFQLIRERRFYDAKMTWIKGMNSDGLNFRVDMKSPTLKQQLNAKRTFIDCVGNEFNYFFVQISSLFPYKTWYKCLNCNSSQTVIKSFCTVNAAKIVDFQRKINENVAKNTRCQTCDVFMSKRNCFLDGPPKILMFYLDSTFNYTDDKGVRHTNISFRESDLKKHQNIEILNVSYRLFAYTLNDESRFHFYAVYNTIPKMRYDGLVGDSVMEHTPTKLPVCALVYELNQIDAYVE